MTSDQPDMRQAWIDFCDEIKGAVDYVFDPDQVTDSPVDEAEGVRHVLRSLIKASLATFENSDAQHPELGWFHPSKMGLDNPDAFYQSAPVDLHYAYELSGNIGSVAYLGFALMSMNWGTGEIELLRSLNVAELAPDEAGQFAVILSPDPDPGDTGHPWFQLPEKQTSLLVRQFLSDWENEDVAEMSLRCLDPDGLPPRMTPAELVANLGRVASEVNRVPQHWNDYYRGHIERGEVNSFAHIEPVPAEDVGALGGSTEQLYAECWFEVGPSEALLIEVEVPDCVYWNVQLGDIWGQSVDWVNRQTSLSGGQAVLDDGVFRAVLSHADPGYANWLDLHDLSQGLVLFRWNQSDVVPLPQARVVSIDELAAAMPVTELAVSLSDRADVLARRRRAALGRVLR
jgi:hypothetical protein